MTETTASTDSGAVESSPSADTSTAPASTTASTDIYGGSTPSETVQSSPEASTSQAEGSIINQLYTSEGGLSENYTDLLKGAGMESLTGTVQKYKSADGLLKGAANLVNFAGKKVDGVIVPNEASSPEEVAEFQRAIGVPESATEYDLRLENLPEGLDWNDNLAEQWGGVFHEAGLNQEQALKLSQAYSDITAKQLSEGTEKLANHAESVMGEQQAALQKQWGREYDRNIQSAVDMAEVVGFDMENEADMAAVRNPKVMNMLLAKSQGMQEGTMPRNGQPSASANETAKAKADAIYQKHNGQVHLAPPEMQKAYSELRKMEYQTKR